MSAVWVWIGYLGVEPFARKRMPHLLVSSTRLLTGRWRDAQVGRDILYGITLAVALRLFNGLTNLYMIPHVNGETPEMPWATRLGLASTAAQCLTSFTNAVLTMLVLLGLFVLYRSVLRKPWLAVGALFLTLAVLNLQNENAWFDLSINAAVCVVLVAFIVRCGLVAGVVFFWGQALVGSMPWTHDLSNWTAEYYVVPGLVLVALLVWGFTSAIGDQKIFGSFSLEE